jgi:hypothetical protein
LNQANRAFISEQETDPATGQKVITSPITGRNIPLQPPPPMQAPDRFSEIMGSGAATMMHHPILSTFFPGSTFAEGASNELLKDLPTPVRQAAGAIIGLVGVGGAAHLMSQVGHLASGHFGGIGTILGSILKAPSSPHAFDAANALTRIARSYAGEGVGSEAPISRSNQLLPTPPIPPGPSSGLTGPSPREHDITPVPGPSMAERAASGLYHWGGFLGMPSAADMVNNLTPR